MIYKDILGQELKIGDRIAYARIGSGTDHGSLGIGTILKLEQKEGPWYAKEPVPVAMIEWETNSDYSRYPSIYSKPKKSTVTKFENMVKI